MLMTPILVVDPNISSRKIAVSFPKSDAFFASIQDVFASDCYRYRNDNQSEEAIMTCASLETLAIAAIFMMPKETRESKKVGERIGRLMMYLVNWNERFPYHVDDPKYRDNELYTLDMLCRKTENKKAIFAYINVREYFLGD